MSPQRISFELLCLFLLSAVAFVACSSGDDCTATENTYCADSHTYAVDSCGELTDHLAFCDCGCNFDHTGCIDCNCTADCGEKECGDDGCGGSCGHCQTGQTCNDAGLCVTGCTPDCANKECGGDGCGGSCGNCQEGESCDASGQCVTGCTPNCANKECGDDGCEGSCGSCDDPETCSASGQCESGTLTLLAQAVGAYSQVGSTCDGGSIMNGYGAFLCPGGKLRGAGQFDSATNLWCGDFTVSPAVYEDCTDMLGCFPKVSATVKDTLIFGGQQDVEYGFEFDMYLTTDGEDTFLYKGAQCSDQSSGFIVLQRIAFDVTENYCHSDACPQDGGSTGGSGFCGTDCDCGHCWYCENSTCYYGGEGPYGCYRGCPW